MSIKSKYWEGCNVRELKKSTDFTTLSREEFLTECYSIINDAKETAINAGIDPDAAVIPVIRNLCESSLFFFAVYMIGGTDQYLNRDFVYRLCLDVQKYKWDRMWIMAREHFKTTMITQISTLWEVTKDPSMTVGVYSYKHDMAKKILKQIKKYIENNDMFYVLWPEIFWQNPKQKYEYLPDGSRVDFVWSESKLQLRPNVKSGGMDCTFEACGISGSASTGAHYSHQIFDDCETKDNVLTTEAIEKRYEELQLAYNSGKTESLNVCYVGTFYAKEDAYSRFIKEGSVKEAIIQPCFDLEGNPVCYTKEQLEDKRRKIGSLLAWTTQMLCDPSMSSENIFKEEWLRRWNPDPANLKNLNVYLFVDPASSKVSQKHDFTTMIAVGINSLEQILVLDIVRDKLNFDRKYQSLIRMHQKWHPIITFYEEAALTDDTVMLNREMEKNNEFIPLKSYSPVGMGSKDSRLDKLLYKFSLGDIMLPEYCYHNMYTGEMQNVVEVCIRDELFGYPNISHDDFMDALAAPVIFLAEGKLLKPNVAYNEVSMKIKKKVENVWDYSPMKTAKTDSDACYYY